MQFGYIWVHPVRPSGKTSDRWNDPVKATHGIIVKVDERFSGHAAYLVLQFFSIR
jgi:hypothetical protein